MSHIMKYTFSIVLYCACFIGGEGRPKSKYASFGNYFHTGHQPDIIHYALDLKEMNPMDIKHTLDTIRIMQWHSKLSIVLINVNEAQLIKTSHVLNKTEAKTWLEDTKNQLLDYKKGLGHMDLTHFGFEKLAKDVHYTSKIDLSGHGAKQLILIITNVNECLPPLKQQKDINLKVFKFVIGRKERHHDTPQRLACMENDLVETIEVGDSESLKNDMQKSYDRHIKVHQHKMT